MSASATTPTIDPPVRSTAIDRVTQMPLWLRGASLAGGVVLLLTICRIIGDAPDLTGASSWRGALRLAAPIALAGLGGLFAERSGIVNVGLEGMMVLGTIGAGWAGWHWGPWWGVVAGIVFGAIGGLLHAVMTVSFGVNHVVSGVAINILAPGVARFLASTWFSGVEGASATLGPQISGRIGSFTLPIISGGRLGTWHSPDFAGWLEKKHWFFISDIAGVLKGVTSDLTLLTILVIAMFPLSSYVLWRTAFGLRLRACGEKPSAADSLGVAVYKTRYLAVMISGGFAGMAGGYLVTVSGANRFLENQTNNRGFIGLATLIFGNWKPAGVAAGAGLFGFADSLTNRVSSAPVRATLLFIALLAALWAIWIATQRRVKPAIALAGAAAMFLFFYVTVDKVPRDLVFLLPPAATLLVLAVASQRLRPPAAAGAIWRRGDTG